MKTIELIDKSNVMSVYSGRPGCCCGCRGKHYYASALRGDATVKRGYSIQDDEVNDGMVTRVVNLINKAIEDGSEVEIKKDYYCLETESRWYIAYLIQ